MNITPYGKPLSKNDIEKFEKSLSIKLPEDYKAFMLKNNGGTPEEENTYVFNFTNDSDEEDDFVLHEFFPIIYEKSDNYYYDVATAYEDCTEEEQLPKNILPIGDDPFGNLIGMCISGENYGKIYFCDHEYNFMATSFLANSFTEFLNNFYISKDWHILLEK